MFSFFEQDFDSEDLRAKLWYMQKQYYTSRMYGFEDTALAEEINQLAEKINQEDLQSLQSYYENVGDSNNWETTTTTATTTAEITSANLREDLVGEKEQQQQETEVQQPLVNRDSEVERLQAKIVELQEALRLAQQGQHIKEALATTETTTNNDGTGVREFVNKNIYFEDEILVIEEEEDDVNDPHASNFLVEPASSAECQELTSSCNSLGLEQQQTSSQQHHHRVKEQMKAEKDDISQDKDKKNMFVEKDNISKERIMFSIEQYGDQAHEYRRRFIYALQNNLVLPSIPKLEPPHYDYTIYLEEAKTELAKSKYLFSDLLESDKNFSKKNFNYRDSLSPFKMKKEEEEEEHGSDYAQSKRCGVKCKMKQQSSSNVVFDVH